MPTTMTMSRSNVKKALENIRGVMLKTPGAQPLGFHLEGPFTGVITFSLFNVCTVKYKGDYL